MKSALSIVAFTNATQRAGTIALLETALESLDKAGSKVAAAYVDSALFLLRKDCDECVENKACAPAH